MFDACVVETPRGADGSVDDPGQIGVAEPSSSGAVFLVNAHPATLAIRHMPGHVASTDILLGPMCQALEGSS